MSNILSKFYWDFDWDQRDSLFNKVSNLPKFSATIADIIVLMMVFNNKRTEVAKLLLLIDPTDSPPLANVINKLETVMRSIRNQYNKTRISQI